MSRFKPCAGPIDIVLWDGSDLKVLARDVGNPALWVAAPPPPPLAPPATIVGDTPA